MKEVEVTIGIILIVIGALLFEMNGGTLITMFGLTLMSIGVMLYILVVDSLDKTKKKKMKRGDIYLRFLPVR